jgi:hypothetical protein
MHRDTYPSLRDRAKTLFDQNPSIYCPYFNADVVLNADGLHHLIWRYSDRRERSKQEQMLKFHLLPLALEVIRKTGTVQEYPHLSAGRRCES